MTGGNRPIPEVNHWFVPGICPKGWSQEELGWCWLVPGNQGSAHPHSSGLSAVAEIPPFPVHSFRISIALSQPTVKHQIPWEGPLCSLSTLWSEQCREGDVEGSPWAKRMSECPFPVSRDCCPLWASHTTPSQAAESHIPGRAKTWGSKLDSSPSSALSFPLAEDWMARCYHSRGRMEASSGLGCTWGKSVFLPCLLGKPQAGLLALPEEHFQALDLSFSTFQIRNITCTIYLSGVIGTCFKGVGKV